MARKKVTLAFIANDAARRATLKKRRKSLIKKVSELATLCDVKASIIIYGPNETAPEVWPSEEQARQMLSKFRSLSEQQQVKNQMNQMSFLQQRAAKMTEQLRKTEQGVREIQMEVLAYEVMIGRELHDLAPDTLVGLQNFLDAKLKSLHDMVEAAMKLEVAREAQINGALPVDQGLDQNVNVVSAVMEEMQRQQSGGFAVAPGMQAGPPSKEQVVRGNSGGLGDVIQPFADNGKRWNMDPSIFTL